MEERMPKTTFLEQCDIQNKFAYPKHIHDVVSEERCKQSYIKHRANRRSSKKTRPISLSTINENYATDSFP
uniref:Ovule protein n=1 Tax=Elaeophora elaphi TaxID=1147741 RepID=A0A0R3RMV7_9BILA